MCWPDHPESKIFLRSDMHHWKSCPAKKVITIDGWATVCEFVKKYHYPWDGKQNDAL